MFLLITTPEMLRESLKLLGELMVVATPIIASVAWMLKQFRDAIIGDLQAEIDRNQAEINNINCFLERRNPKEFSRLFFSGVWRSVFYKSCNTDE